MAKAKSKLEFLIDPALDEDRRKRLVEIWVDVANAGGAVGFVPPVTTEMVEPVADISFRRILGGLDHIIVVQIGGKEVGFAFLEMRPGTLFSHWATVRRLQIHPQFQERGLGSALLDAVHDAAREMGLEQLHLTVRGGTGAEEFYERHGYRVVARIPEVIKVAPNDIRDEIYLIARL